jgi:hypothetical protein
MLIKENLIVRLLHYSKIAKLVALSFTDVNASLIDFKSAVREVSFKTLIRLNTPL